MSQVKFAAHQSRVPLIFNLAFVSRRGPILNSRCRAARRSRRPPGWTPRTSTSARSSGSLVRRVPAMEHELVAVRVGEERHVADAGVERLADELHALGFELGARLRHVV